MSNSSPKLAAAVILYHPTDEVVTNINSYIDFVDIVYLLDNTEFATPIQSALQKLRKVVLIHDHDNKGISARLNEAATIAIKDRFEWLLTLDQDSYFTENGIKEYVSCFSKYKAKDHVAAFCPRYRHDDKRFDNCDSEDVEEAITSGMLLNLQPFSKIGGFDEALFIDSVDHEYCIRAKMAGYSIIRFNTVYLHHKLGTLVNRSSIKSLFLIKKKKEIHSALRVYYMYRNMLYLEDKYKYSNPVFSKLIRKYVMTHVKVCLLYGRETWQILKYLAVAKKDFKNGRMGKITKQL